MNQVLLRSKFEDVPANGDIIKQLIISAGEQHIQVRSICTLGIYIVYIPQR